MPSSASAWIPNHETLSPVWASWRMSRKSIVPFSGEPPCTMCGSRNTVFTRKFRSQMYFRPNAAPLPRGVGCVDSALRELPRGTNWLGRFWRGDSSHSHPPWPPPSTEQLPYQRSSTSYVSILKKTNSPVSHARLTIFFTLLFGGSGGLTRSTIHGYLVFYQVPHFAKMTQGLRNSK